MLGWLGVFITGSDTSANALFGKLQAATATSIGVDSKLLPHSRNVHFVIFTFYFAANGVRACFHISTAPAISVSSKEQ